MNLNPLDPIAKRRM